MASAVSVKTPPPVQSAGLPNPSTITSTVPHAPNPGNQVEVTQKLLEEKNVPINFYGQTVDQDDNPLADVDVTVQVRHYDASVFGTSIKVDRKSDSAGLFDIHNVTGDAFDLESISKKGYNAEPTRRGWGPTGGAPGNPVIFRLWRNDIKEPLITGQKSFEVLADGSPYILSVTTNGFIHSDAPREDFSISLNIPQPQDEAHPNWSFEFEAANGGIAEEMAPAAAMYRAPEGGYTNLFRFVLDDAHPWMRASSKFNFYFYLADRKVYGRISFELMFFRNKPPYIRTEYAINPTGSRILR